MRSSFFYDGHYRQIGNRLKKHLNSHPSFLSSQTSHSTRAVGDAVESIVADVFGDLLGDWCKEYSASFARRAMADLAFMDKEGFYCIADVKTHRENTAFSRPNLTSVERLSRFYEEDSNIFSLIIVRYRVDGNKIAVSEVIFLPIEFLDWDCLTIGALGWGQIQIADSNNIISNHGFSRKKWMLSLCDVVLDFYPKEILKIEERIDRFGEVKSYWGSKQDVWV